jgi:hypothetical protein
LAFCFAVSFRVQTCATDPAVTFAATLKVRHDHSSEPRHFATCNQSLSDSHLRRFLSRKENQRSVGSKSRATAARRSRKDLVFRLQRSLVLLQMSAKARVQANLLKRREEKVIIKTMSLVCSHCECRKRHLRTPRSEAARLPRMMMYALCSSRSTFRAYWSPFLYAFFRANNLLRMGKSAQMTPPRCARRVLMTTVTSSPLRPSWYGSFSNCPAFTSLTRIRCRKQKSLPLEQSPFCRSLLRRRSLIGSASLSARKTFFVSSDIALALLCF